MKHTIILLLFSYSLFGQPDTLNQRNARGKKDGYWKVYLNERANRTDSINAYFFGFELYDSGEKLFQFGSHLKSTVYDGIMPTKGSPIPINGKFSDYYSRSNKLMTEETYKEGHPVCFKQFGKEEAIFKEIDYTKKFNNVRGTCLLKTYSKGKVEEAWFRKGENGWLFYPINKQ